MTNQFIKFFMMFSLISIHVFSATNTETITLFDKVYAPGSLQIEQNDSDILMYNSDHMSTSKDTPHVWYVKHKIHQLEWLELEYFTTEGAVEKINGHTYYKLNDDNGAALIQLHYKDFKRTSNNSEFNYPFEISVSGMVFTGTLTAAEGETVDLFKDRSKIGRIRFSDCEMEGACLTITPIFD